MKTCYKSFYDPVGRDAVSEYYKLKDKLELTAEEVEMLKRREKNELIKTRERSYKSCIPQI